MSGPEAVNAVTVVPVRRKRPGAAGAAYSHALAVLRRPSEATVIARSALRRGAHSRTAVMAHARHGALERAGDFVPTEGSEAPSSDIRNLAWQLAGTRPAIERSLVDLELRYGLSTSNFARILGVSSARATQRSAEIAELWATHLDTAMLAWLGPGSCEGFNTVLSSSGWSEAPAEPTDNDVGTASDNPVTARTVDDLLAIAPAVRQHSQDCDLCSERLAQLTSVRSLVGHRALETVPAAVVGTARESKHRVAGPLPPGIDPRRFDFRRLSTSAGYGALALCLFVAFLVFRTTDNDSETQSERVDRLVQNQAIAPFLATPSIISGTSSRVTLTNNDGNQPLDWSASSNAPWLTTNPVNGRIAPGDTIVVEVAARAGSSSVDQSAVLQFRSSAGAIQTVRYEVDGG